MATSATPIGNAREPWEYGVVHVIICLWVQMRDIAGSCDPGGSSADLRLAVRQTLSNSEYASLCCARVVYMRHASVLFIGSLRVSASYLSFLLLFVFYFCFLFCLFSIVFVSFTVCLRKF